MPSADRATPAAAPSSPDARPDVPPVIAALPDGPRARMLPLLARLSLESGVTFMHEGEVTRFLAIIVTGRVALRMRVPERGAITTLTLDAGDIAGWSAIVPPYRATCSATTLEPTELAIVDAATLREVLATDCDVAAAFLPPMMETIAARLAATRDQLLDLFRGSGLDPW